MRAGGPSIVSELTHIVALARRQGGVLTASQARELGFNWDRLMTLISRGLVVRQFGASQFIVKAAVQADYLAVAHGLMLRLGPQSVVSGAAAAQRLGATGDWPGVFCVNTPIAYLPRRSHAVVDGVRLLRHTMDGRIVPRGQLRLADMTTALLDCVDSAIPAQREPLVDFLLQRRWLDRARVAQRISARRAGGRTGRRVTMAQIKTLRQARDGTESAAERLLGRLLLKAKLSRGGKFGWVANHTVRVADGAVEVDGPGGRAGSGGIGRSRGAASAAGRLRTARIDFAWPDCRLAVEVDGRAFHSGDEAFEKDRDRRNDLEAAGWMVLNVTWKALTRAPDAVIRRVCAALEQRRSAPHPP